MALMPIGSTKAPEEMATGAMEKKSAEEEFERRSDTIVSIEDGVVLNASGHQDELKRQYGLLGICGLALYGFRKMPLFLV